MRVEYLYTRSSDQMECSDEPLSRELKSEAEAVFRIVSWHCPKILFGVPFNVHSIERSIL